jgi:16S rRNA processing protein RimM
VGGRKYEIDGFRPFRDTEVLLTLRGVGDRTAAEALRRLEVEVDRREFPTLAPGEYYLADLIGLTAIDFSGKPFGRVSGLIETGAAPVLRVDGAKEILVPTSGPFIRRVDVAAGTIEIDPPLSEEDT